MIARERWYHVVAISERTGKKTMLTVAAVTHREASTIIGKFTSRKERRIQMEETSAGRYCFFRGR